MSSLDDQTMSQTVTRNDGYDGLSGSGGGQIITQPFSPGDTGNVSMTGSKRSLGRFLEKAGVQKDVVEKVSTLSVKLFVSMDGEGLHHFAGEDPGHRAVLRSAHAALKSELDEIEKERLRKRSKGMPDDDDDDEEVENPLSCLSRVASLRTIALATRGNQPASTATVVYSDPYRIGLESDQGKEQMLNIYGTQGSDGTVYSRRMQSSQYGIAEKGTVIIKIPYLNLGLVSTNKTDVAKRAELFSTVLVMTDQSRWGPLFQWNWDINIDNFINVAFQHWALPEAERTIVGWYGIEKLKMVENCTALQSSATMEALFAFKWTVTGGLCIASFEDQKGESRTSSSGPSNNHNAGFAGVVKRLNNIMIALMSNSYGDVFTPFSHFVTEDDSVTSMGGDQVAYNFDQALNKVSNSIQTGNPMRLGNGDEYGTRGHREVARAIIAALEYQIGQMRSRETMRNQKEDFKELMNRQLARSRPRSNEKIASREITQTSTHESDELIRQPWPEDTRRGKGGPKGGPKGGAKGGVDIKKEGVAKTEKKQHKTNYLCVAYLGESLGAGSICTKGDKCFYMHRRAADITRIEAEEAMVKPADSVEKRAIQKKITEFTKFKK
jgi:hypothetical protein